MKVPIWLLVIPLLFASGCCCQDGEWEYSYKTGDAEGGETEGDMGGFPEDGVGGLPVLTVEDAVSIFKDALVAGDYTQLYMAGGPTPIVGTLVVHTSDPDDPSNSYEPKAGDVFHLIVTGPLDAGRFGGMKGPATFSYPDPEKLLNLNNAPLRPGLEWDVQMRPDGLSLDSGSGEISGTPTIADDYTFTVGVEDTVTGSTHSRQFSITVAAAG